MGECSQSKPFPFTGSLSYAIAFSRKKALLEKKGFELRLFF